MHMLNLLLFVGAVAARGFTIPEGTPNGVYKVTYDAEGEATHTFIGNTTIDEAQVAEIPKVKARSSRFRAREDDEVHCGGYDLGHDDADHAVQMLRNQCNPGAIGSGLDFYSIWGGVVAYEYNYSGVAVVCTNQEINDSIVQWDRVCGRYRASWRDLHSDQRFIQIGYEASNAKFCGRGP